jgi:hypothetical protein
MEQAVALLIGALTTAILMASSYYFGPGGRAPKGERRKQNRGRHSRRSNDTDRYRRSDDDPDYWKDE